MPASVHRLPQFRSSHRREAVLSVAEYLEGWLWSKQALRPSTHAAYETHVRRYLVPHLGDLDLGDLRPPNVQHMYQRITESAGAERELSASTLRRIHATLMSALNTAVRQGMIERNPAATVELPRPVKARTSAWTAEEFKAFLDAIKGDPLELLFLVLGLVGLRRGEVVALRWQEVDFVVGSLRIERSAVRVANRTVVGPPKSARSNRTVAIDRETSRRLQTHRERQQWEVQRRTGKGQASELVFTAPDGEQLDPTHVSRHFDRLVARHGMTRIRLHDLRHTSASIGLAAGESLVEVSRRLGHSSITVTADIYSHINPVVATESAERLANTVFNAARS